MSPNPTRDTPVGRAYNDLRNLAKAQGRDPAEYLALYALEGFLTRLAASDLRDDFVLKGGVLLAAFAARRPTRDIDLAASGFPNDVDDVERRVRTILAVDVVDGLEFDLGAVRSETIRDEADYTGVRVHLLAVVSKARVPIHVDVNFGDPIWPAPQATTLPLLLGGEVELNGYPAHMVLAEKIVTAIDRGAANTRWRDFVDIASISRTQAIDGGSSQPRSESWRTTGTWESGASTSRSPAWARSHSPGGAPGDASSVWQAARRSAFTTCSTRS